MPRRRNGKKKRARWFWENSAMWTPSKRLTALWRRNLPVAVNASKNWKNERTNSPKTDDAPSKAEKPEEEAKPDAEPAPAQSLSEADTAQRTTAQKFDTAKEKTENELYEAARNSEAVRLRIIGDYLSSLRGADAP